jgi:uncharacterized protein
MIINKIEIAPGQNKIIKLNVSKLPSGTEIDIFVNVYRSKKPGPTILVLGGLHGDEINGVEIVRKSINEKLFDRLKCGAIIAIPLLNVYGFINFSRDLPDGKDINRSFPGNSKGSLASRVAKQLTQHILPLVDIGIDFHTGGKSIHNVPQVRIDSNLPNSEALARVFDSPFIVKSKVIPRSLRKECSRLKIPMLVFEGGESLRIHKESVKVGVQGIKNILVHYKMIVGVSKTEKNNIFIKESHWIRANYAGIFKPQVEAGEFVAKGRIIGVISTPFETRIKKIKARKDGYIFGLNNNPVINQGDALFHIGI